MKPYAIVDQNQKPIVNVTFTGEKSTDENFQKYLEDLATCYDDRKSIAIIFDASHAVIPKLSLQRKQALWISQHWKLIQTYCKGTAYVIPNLAIRAVLNVIFLFKISRLLIKFFQILEKRKIGLRIWSVKQR